jgi:hypothetical protein
MSAGAENNEAKTGLSESIRGAFFIQGGISW